MLFTDARRRRSSLFLMEETQLLALTDGLTGL
jgi:hypothetical protein